MEGTRGSIFYSSHQYCENDSRTPFCAFCVALRFCNCTLKVEYVKVYKHKMSGVRTLSRIGVSGIVVDRVNRLPLKFYVGPNDSAL